MPDITLTLDPNAFDTYLVTAPSSLGASFVVSHVSIKVTAADARLMRDKAQRCGLIVTME